MLAACGGDDEPAGGQPAAELPTATESGEESEEASDCRKVDAPKPKKVSLDDPKRKLATSDRYTAVVRTNCGSFEIALDSKRSPKTAGSFAFLAEKGVFDGTAFHRIVPGFVVQGGDPEGTGSGGPGYSVTEKPADTTVYRRGVVAMAKTGAEPPGTSGSQFFVVTAPADAGLPPEYAFLGKVTKGMGVVERIEKLGDPATEQPSETVVIQRVTLRKG